jgi:hypothetical protein
MPSPNAKKLRPSSASSAKFHVPDASATRMRRADRFLDEIAPELERQRSRALRLNDAIAASVAARADSQTAADEGEKDLERTLQKLGEQSRPVANMVRLCLKQIDARSFRHGKRMGSTAEELEKLSHADSEAQLADMKDIARRQVAQREAMLTCALAEIRHAETDADCSIRVLQERVRALQSDGRRQDAHIEQLEKALADCERRLAKEQAARRADADRWTAESLSMRREAEEMEARMATQRRHLEAGAAARQSCWDMAQQIESLSHNLKTEQESRQVVVSEYRQKLATRGAAAHEEQRLLSELLAVSQAEHTATRSRLSSQLEEATNGKDLFEAALRRTAADRWVSLSRSGYGTAAAQGSSASASAAATSAAGLSSSPPRPTLRLATGAGVGSPPSARRSSARTPPPGSPSRPAVGSTAARAAANLHTSYSSACLGESGDERRLGSWGSAPTLTTHGKRGDSTAARYARPNSATGFGAASPSAMSPERLFQAHLLQIQQVLPDAPIGELPFTRAG